MHQNRTFTSGSDRRIAILSEGMESRLFVTFVLNDGKSLALTISRRAESSLCSKNAASRIFSLHTEYQKPILLCMSIFSPARSFSCSAFLFDCLIQHSSVCGYLRLSLKPFRGSCFFKSVPVSYAKLIKFVRILQLHY